MKPHNCTKTRGQDHYQICPVPFVSNLQACSPKIIVHYCCILGSSFDSSKGILQSLRFKPVLRAINSCQSMHEQRGDMDDAKAILRLSEQRFAQIKEKMNTFWYHVEAKLWSGTYGISNSFILLSILFSEISMFTSRKMQLMHPFWSRLELKNVCLYTCTLVFSQMNFQPSNWRHWGSVWGGKRCCLVKDLITHKFHSGQASMSKSTNFIKSYAIGF